MLVIGGKAVPNEERHHDEFFLQEFRAMQQDQGRFVYAWSFNPDEQAIRLIQDHFARNEEIYLYLPSHEGRGGQSNLRMHVIDFRHNCGGIDMCPAEWRPYCIEGLQGRQAWVHLWFLVDKIEELSPPVYLLDRNTFVPAHPEGKYKNYGQNYFAFLFPREALIEYHC